VLAGLLGAALMTASGRASATEGGASYYFPGAFGSFAVAVAPEPGFLFANQTLIYGAELDRAVLQGRVNANLEAFAVYNNLAPAYTFTETVLGGRFQLSGFLPVGYANLEATVTGPLIGTRRDSASDFNIGDGGLWPAIYWSFGDFHVKLSELIVVPTGHYDSGDTVNVGRNYWAFDTQLGLTWLNPKTGTEVSLLPGIMFNTENDATDYRSGDEFHLDFMLNQFLSKSFAVGFQGYWYKQVSGDSGAGALLGDFKGESVGVGLGFLWLPEFAKGRLSIVGQWIHDLDATNRLEADYGQVTFGYKF
jgi:hypothetical protein